MLKGEKLSTPYFNLHANSGVDLTCLSSSSCVAGTGSSSSSNATNHSTSSGGVITSSALANLARLSSSSLSSRELINSFNAVNQQQKVTRRRIHEICGKDDFFDL